jgi:hypothetical protein
MSGQSRKLELSAVEKLQLRVKVKDKDMAMGGLCPLMLALEFESPTPCFLDLVYHLSLQGASELVSKWE